MEKWRKEGERCNRIYEKSNTTREQKTDVTEERYEVVKQREDRPTPCSIPSYTNGTVIRIRSFITEQPTMLQKHKNHHNKNKSSFSDNLKNTLTKNKKDIPAQTVMLLVDLLHLASLGINIIQRWKVNVIVCRCVIFIYAQTQLQHSVDPVAKGVRIF